jgi:hypothetical protein
MAPFSEFGSLGHLAGRFFGSLLPIGPAGADERWAQEHLLPGERDLWQRMSRVDRRHAVGVARRTVIELDGGTGNGPAAAGRDVVAAALLHDVGKIQAGIGTWGRAGVTLAAMAAGRERLAGWSTSGRRAWQRRVGLYLTHDRVGAELLATAGSDPLTVAWAGEHHRPRQRWSVDSRLGDALKAADDD